jgi:hypothetical protein
LTKRALAALIACLAIAAVAAGCGGGSDSTNSGDTTSGGGESTEASGSAPTKAVFIKEADKICGDADETLNEEIGEYAEENDIPLEKEEPTEDQQVELYEEVVLPNVAQQGEEIGELTPPEGDEETVEEIVDGLAEGVEEAEEDPQQLTEGKNPLADASKKARAYGMTTCGSE